MSVGVGGVYYRADSSGAKRSERRESVVSGHETDSMLVEGKSKMGQQLEEEEEAPQRGGELLEEE